MPVQRQGAAQSSAQPPSDAQLQDSLREEWDGLIDRNIEIEEIKQSDVGSRP